MDVSCSVHCLPLGGRAPTVFCHCGGSALLGEPDLLNQITSAVCVLVPVHLPFTAKMRLAIDDTSWTSNCAQALYDRLRSIKAALLEAGVLNNLPLAA